MDGNNPRRLPPLHPYGDQYLLVQLGNKVDSAIHCRVTAIAEKAYNDKIPGIQEILPSYGSLLVHYDPLRLSFTEAATWVEKLAVCSPPRYRKRNQSRK